MSGFEEIAVLFRVAVFTAVEPPRIGGTSFLHQFAERSGRFVTHCHQREGRVIAIGFQNAIQFVDDEPVAFGMLSEMRGVHRPQRDFDLEKEAQFVGCSERRFRRTPRVETHVIEPV